jgi:Domain of Unknown Function (DUF1521)
MTVTTGAGFGFGFGITQGGQSDLMGQVGQGGQQLANLMTQYRWPGGCGEGGRQRLGETLMRDGEQEVQEGEQLIEMGDVRDGMQLVNQGTQLIMEGAALMAGGMMPGGINPMDPFDPMGGSPVLTGAGGQDPFNPIGGQDPCNPMGGYGSPVLTGMGGQDPCNPMGGYGSPFPTGMGGQGPCGPMGGQYGGNGFGGGGMSVDTSNNTVTVGDYKITASADESGKLTVTNTCTNQTFSVWGDPHISTANGGVADFQHNNATIKLPNGAEINITPTKNPTGPNTMSNVVVTYRNQAASFNFANGSVQTQNMPGQGYALDDTLPGGVQMTATPDGNLILAKNGAEIGPKTGNIDADATNAPMGFGTPFGTGMATNGGYFNFAQFVGIGTQEMLDSVMDV